MNKDKQTSEENKAIDARGSQGFLNQPSGPVEQVFGTKIIQNIVRGGPETQWSSRSRQNMLQLVWNTWIEGVLQKSLYNEILIELDMETRPDALNHPWDMAVQMPEQPPRMLPPGTTLEALFDRTAGALLVLGEPGAGKTTMLLELARQLIERAKNDTSHPIPVVFHLASWRPKQTIVEWLVSELKSKYSIPKKLGQAWIESYQILLLLDGLDEVRKEDIEACVDAINVFRDGFNVQLAICSRHQEYETLHNRLQLGGAVLIKALTPAQVDNYLAQAGAEFGVIQQALQRDPELAEFARTPLILNIMILTYWNADPEKLRFLERAVDFRKQLFDDYIEKMLKRRGIGEHYSHTDTKGWLAWLAQAMNEHELTLFHIEVIQPSWCPNSVRKIGLITGSIYGLMLGLVLGLYLGLWVGLLQGLIGGLVIGLMYFGLWFYIFMGAVDAEPTDKLVWSWRGFRTGLADGARLFGRATPIAVLFIIGLDALLSRLPTFLGISPLLNGVLRAEPVTKLITLFGFALAATAFFVIMMGFVKGLTGAAVEERLNPDQGIRNSFQNWLISGLTAGMISAPALGLAVGLTAGPMTVIFGGPVFLILIYSILAPIYGINFILRHIVSHWLLYRSGRLPWNLVAFLDYCTDRIFLRRVGGGYLFIYRMLMEHFAAMATSTQESNSAAKAAGR